LRRNFQVEGALRRSRQIELDPARTHIGRAPEVGSADLARSCNGKMTMPKIRFHKLAAIVVLIGFAAWMGTGAFSSVGSAANKQADAGKPAQPEAAKPGKAEAERRPHRAPSRW